MQLYKVFVYGTLKKDEGNHRLLEHSKFLGNEIIRGFKMYDLFWGFPCIVPSSDEEDTVSGEVYEVDLPTLYSLDVLEGYTEGRDDNHYNRVKTNGDTFNDILVYCYRETPKDVFAPTLIKDGFWCREVNRDNYLEMRNIYNNGYWIE